MKRRCPNHWTKGTKKPFFIYRAPRIEVVRFLSIRNSIFRLCSSWRFMMWIRRVGPPSYGFPHRPSDTPTMPHSLGERESASPVYGLVPGLPAKRPRSRMQLKKLTVIPGLAGMFPVDARADLFKFISYWHESEGNLFLPSNGESRKPELITTKEKRVLFTSVPFVAYFDWTELILLRYVISPYFNRWFLFDCEYDWLFKTWSWLAHTFSWDWASFACDKAQPKGFLIHLTVISLTPLGRLWPPLSTLAQTCSS